MIKRIGFTVLALLAFSMAAQAADMHSGTWVMNVAKSTSSDGNLPRSSTQVVSMDGGWQIVKNHGVDKDGNATSQNLINKLDGVARPRIGYAGPAAFGMLQTSTQSDDFHWKLVGIAITGKARETQTTVISPDGKGKTNTTTVDKDGKTSNRVSVWTSSR